MAVRITSTLASQFPRRRRFSLTQLIYWNEILRRGTEEITVKCRATIRNSCQVLINVFGGVRKHRRLSWTIKLRGLHDFPLLRPSKQFKTSRWPCEAFIYKRDWRRAKKDLASRRDAGFARVNPHQSGSISEPEKHWREKMMNNCSAGQSSPISRVGGK